MANGAAPVSGKRIPAATGCGEGSAGVLTLAETKRLVSEVRAGYCNEQQTIVDIGAIGGRHIIKIATNMVTAGERARGPQKRWRLCSIRAFQWKNLTDALKQKLQQSGTLDLKVQRIIRRISNRILFRISGPFHPPSTPLFPFFLLFADCNLNICKQGLNGKKMRFEIRRDNRGTFKSSVRNVEFA